MGLEKTYETVSLNRLWKILEDVKINVTVIGNLYSGVMLKFKVGKSFLNSILVTKGL